MSFAGKDLFVSNLNFRTFVGEGAHFWYVHHFDHHVGVAIGIRDALVQDEFGQTCEILCCCLRYLSAPSDATSNASSE
jgi:hypothetical protein